MSPNLTQLGDACEFIKDGTHGSPERTVGGFPVLSAEHVQDGRLSFRTGRFTSQRELDVFQKRLRPQPGDVLLTIVGTIGRTAILRETTPFVFQRSVCVLRPRARVLDSEYLSWALSSDFVVRQIEKETKQVAQAGIYLDSINGIELPLPDLSEQQRISQLLGQADRLRRTRRYALELSDSFLPAAFLELFGSHEKSWPAVTVEELAAPKRGAIRTGPFGSQLLHSEFTDSGIAVLGIDNAVYNRFEWAERRFISLAKYDELKRYTVFPGDVLITIMGTCGRCAVVPDGMPTAVNTKHLCCITLDQSKCMPVFLHAAFLHHPEIGRQLGVLQKGAIMDGLNMEIIKGLAFPLPPLHLQNSFAKLVERHERLRATQREALRQAEHLFQTLLHRAFSEGMSC